MNRLLGVMAFTLAVVAVAGGITTGSGVDVSHPVIVAPDGGTPTCFATQPPALFTAADCAAALIAAGGTLPVGAFLALTRDALLADGGWVDPGQPTAAGCEFVQPGANVSHSRFWWTVRDVRDAATVHATLATFASGVAQLFYTVREAGQTTAGDWTGYLNVSVGSASTINSTTAAGAAHVAGSTAFITHARGGELAFALKCTTACVASGDGAP